jgi:hypothetical protein
MRYVTTTETRAPVRPAMNLDTGKLTARDALGIGALALGCLFAGTLGGALAWGAGPGPYGTFAQIGGFRIWLVTFGWAVAALGYGLALVVSWLTWVDWTAYLRRLDDWHQVAIAAVEAADGQEVEQTFTAWELSATVPRDVLLAALAVHHRVQSGDASAHSVRALAGDCWIAGLRLGDVSSSQAAELGRVFAELGLIQGRGKRSAGSWKPDSADEVIQLVESNWGRVGK